MKSDVFKVSFHPFNLVNNLKCFQCCSSMGLTSVLGRFGLEDVNLA